jgi:hypothetical protein
MNQPLGSIGTWTDLCEKFVAAFQGGYKRRVTMSDIFLIIQGPNERFHSFMQHLLHVSHSIPNADEKMIIGTFQQNVCDVRMFEKMGKNQRYLHTTHDLYSLADKCALMEVGRMGPELAAKAFVETTEKDSPGSKKRKCQEKQVLAAEPASPAEPGGVAVAKVATVKVDKGPWCTTYDSS